MNKEEIQQRIPHRDPFLWLDTVTELSDTRIVATKDLAPGLPVFSGHYPDFPVLPGVLQCEACFQAAAILLARLSDPATGQIPVVTRLNNTQFRHMVRPGDTMQVEVTLKEQLAGALFLTGRVTVRGRVTARLEFACAMAPKPSGDPVAGEKND